MSKLSTTVEIFKKNTQAVLQLSDLDRGLLDHTIQSLEERDERLRKAGVNNPRMLAGSTLQSLRNIRQNDSLRPGFQALVNQSVVLLVSYFASGISHLFRAAISQALEINPSDYLRHLQLKVSVAELAEISGELSEALPDLVAESPGISFQDMKSIARTFDNFFGYKIPHDQVTNDITAGLAMRHVLVHNGGIVDRQCIRQLEYASPRNFKPNIKIDDILEFGTDEVKMLADVMVKYVDRISNGLESKLLSNTAYPLCGDNA